MSFQLNSLKPQAGARRRKLRKGRGIAAGQGASCGFGMRGQKSRSGRPTRPGFEGGQMPLYRRIPKLKHFPLVAPRQFSIVNVGGGRPHEASTAISRRCTSCASGRSRQVTVSVTFRPPRNHFDLMAVSVPVRP